MYIIVIGCGKLGSNLAMELSDEGNDVCVIDRDSDKLNALGTGFNGQRIKGIEFDSDKLLEGGIKQADALLAVTSDDNVNLTVSLIAKEIFHVSNTMARVNNPNKISIYNQLGIATINPIQYEIEIIKSRLQIENVEIISTFDSNYEMIGFYVTKNNTMTVLEIERKYDCVISGIVSGESFRIPQKDECIKHDEKIISIVKRDSKRKLINALSKEIIL
jgi:trk system potassium uptake protein TrkA